jgi:uncharacterized protein (TIGR01319 family)
LLVVDIGGATTDVHSICSGDPTHGEVILQGLPEPYVKRTVEGDLGMRHNATWILEAAGLDAIAADAGVLPVRAEKMIRLLHENVDLLPESGEERAVDRALARAAVRLAVRRHAGTTETVYTVTGPVSVQRGKDLSDVGTVIGTGGALTWSAEPGTILEPTRADPAEPLSLRPKGPRLLLDRDYLLYACGLLATVEPAAALTLALTHIRPIGEGGQLGQRSIA